MFERCKCCGSYVIDGRCLACGALRAAITILEQHGISPRDAHEDLAGRPKYFGMDVKTALYYVTIMIDYYDDPQSIN